MRRALLAAVLLVAATLAGTVAPGLVAPASAGVVTGACTTSRGVTVVVNFGSLGGGTQVKCDTSATASTNGANALSGAGFQRDGTTAYGLAFICRINGKPDKSTEKCMTTPPATAYWSYWYASNGGSWTYSSKGATNRSVIVGGFEGWSFHTGTGASTPPTSGSPTRPDPPPQVQPTVKLGPAASTTTTRSSTKPSSSKSSSRTTSATSKATATQGSPSSTSGTSTSANPLATSTSAGSAGGALASDEQDGGGSSWPIFAAVGVIGAILAASLIVGLRRRGAGGF